MTSSQGPYDITTIIITSDDSGSWEQWNFAAINCLQTSQQQGGNFTFKFFKLLFCNNTKTAYHNKTCKNKTLKV